MIQMEYIKVDKKAILNIIFDSFVLSKLKAKVDDCLYFFQSIHALNNFGIIKNDNGYRIKRVPNMRKTYQISCSHQLSSMKEFNLTRCNYFIKKNGMIRFKLENN